MKECVAVGGGGTHEVGYVNPGVLHGFAVPVDEQRVLGFLGPVRFAFSQQLSLFFQLGGVLDETLVGVEIAVLFARGAFGRSADMVGLDLAGSKESMAFGAFLDGPAHAFDTFGGIGFFAVGGGVRLVVGETVFPEEEPMTTATGMVQRHLRLDSIILAPGLMAGGAFLAFAGVVFVTVVVETRLALDAKITLAQEIWEGVTSVVMVTHFDEYDLFGLRRSLEDDLVFVIYGQDDDLMVNEMALKGLEFGQPARPFGNAGLSMEVAGVSFLNGSASS